MYTLSLGGWGETRTALNTEVLFIHQNSLHPYYVTLLRCTILHTTVESSKTYTFLTQRFFIFIRTVYILAMNIIKMYYVIFFLQCGIVYSRI
jgi:hypothetical protein